MAGVLAPRAMRLALLLAGAVVAAAACNGSIVTSGSASAPPSQPTASGEAQSVCDAAVRAAAVPDDMAEVTSLDRAIRACATLADLTAAAVAYPAALKGVSAADIVGYRCRVEPTLASTAICQALPK